jgi:hypothetical protein
MPSTSVCLPRYRPPGLQGVSAGRSQSCGSGPLAKGHALPKHPFPPEAHRLGEEGRGWVHGARPPFDVAGTQAAVLEGRSMIMAMIFYQGICRVYFQEKFQEKAALLIRGHQHVRVQLRVGGRTGDKGFGVAWAKHGIQFRSSRLSASLEMGRR